MWLENLIRDDIKSLEAYQSKNINSSQVAMHANELPWDPLMEYQWQCNRYPQSQDLINKLADFYGVDSASLLLTSGSDISIDQLMRLLVKPFADSVILCPPTFGMYRVYAQIQGANIIECGLGESYEFDRELIKKAMNKTVKLLFLCSPNNPTGNSVSLEDIDALCAAGNGNTIIAVDEAYIEFSDKPSSIELLQRNDNLVILRTLSKAFGLAGLRLGVTIAHPFLINKLKAIAAPFPLAQPSIQLALQALAKQDWYRHKIAAIIEQREYVMEQMQSFECVLTVFPSDANFIFFKIDNAPSLQEFMSSHGIIIRTFSDTQCRISIGLEKDNQRFVELLQQWGQQQ